MKTMKWVAALSIWMSFATHASAQLISRDDATHGPNSITIDASSKLEWLDVTKSTFDETGAYAPLSFNFVSSQFGAGGQFEGFRYATIAELTTLFVNAGIPNISFGPGTLTTANFEPVTQLIALLWGDSVPVSVPVSQLFGLLGEQSPFVPANLAIGMLQAFSDTGLGSADPVQASAPPGEESVGSFLVRRAISIESLQSILSSPDLGLTNGQINSLTDKLQNALTSIQAGLNRQAINQLNAFINSVEASLKTGKMTAQTAAILIAAANAIIAGLQ